MERTLASIHPSIADIDFLDAVTLVTKQQAERLKRKPTVKKTKKAVESITVDAKSVRKKRTRQAKKIDMSKIDLEALSAMLNLKLERI